jgi:MFS family permease
MAEEKRDFYGWKLVSVLWFLDLLNLGFPLYGGSIINTYMLKEIPMSRSTFGTAFGLLNLAAGLPSTIIAASILRFGIRATFGIGSILICFGALWMAFVASQPWHYLIGFGIIVGAGIGFGTIVPLSTALTRWFKRYRGRAMAFAMTASGLAGFVSAPLIDYLLTSNGGDWRQAWIIVATIAVLSGAIAWLLVKERPEDLGQAVDGGEADLTQRPRHASLVTCFEWTPSEAYATPAYWLVFIGSVACQFPFFFMAAHWVLHLKGLGLSAATAAMAMGIYTMGSIAGRLIGGWLMDTIQARFVFMFGMCCTIAGSSIAMNSTSAMIAYIAAILMGAGFGWTFVALNTTVGHFYGPAAFPKLIGSMLLASALACSPAGFIGGKLFDVYQSYSPAFLLIIGICLAAMAALTFAKLPQKQKKAAAAAQ